MANKKLRSQKSNRNKSLSWFSRFGKRNILIVAIFVFAFASAGGFYVFKSYAFWACAQHIYYYYEPGTYGGGCVKNIQYQLNFEDGAGLSPDGIYGYNTAYAVYSFSREHVYGKLYNCGNFTTNNTCSRVGAIQWGALCGYSQNHIYNTWNSDDCWVDLSTYGKYYVGMLTTPQTDRKHFALTRKAYEYSTTG